MSYALETNWECPANIALVKYWGKHRGQLPLNPSVSFALQKAVTKTSVQVCRSSRFSVEFLFEGKPSLFAARAEKYLLSLKGQLPWIAHSSFRIKSSNSFPHSAGIASSASAFGALALCLADIHQNETGQLFSDGAFFRFASGLARQGSGSACRSVFPGISLWGKTPFCEGSDNLFAVPVAKVHPVYRQLRDAVLLVDRSPKQVSSSEGHQLMEGHPFREGRLQQANKNTHNMLQALEEGNLRQFIATVELEALSLHGLMLSSSPPYVLLKPNSLAIIDRIKLFRQQTGVHVGFTIDAGPNIHMLYFEENMQQVHSFINNDLSCFLEDGSWIDDQLGSGPKKLKA